MTKCIKTTDDIKFKKVKNIKLDEDENTLNLD
jgi:hypothetical protein